MIRLAALWWAIWKTQNNIFFEKKLISSQTEIVCLASSFLNYWAGLQAGQSKEELERGAATILKTALHFHTQVYGDDTGLVLLH